MNVTRNSTRMNGFFNSANAFSTGTPVAEVLGGVWGSVRLNTDSTSEATPPMM